MTRYGRGFDGYVRGLGLGLLLAMVLAVLFVDPAGGQQIHRDGHEAREVVWVKGPSDAAPRETNHVITDQTQHTGQSCELLQFEADAGTFINYHYDTGRAPIGEDLAAGVWIKANRPGIQLQARLVLPNERDGTNTQQPLTTLIRGDVYQTTGRWQKLEIRQPVKLVKQQQQIFRGELNRDINMADAYLDRLVLNVYGGPGETEVFIDDLEIGPVLENRPNTAPQAGGSQLMGRPQPRQPVLVEIDRDQLRVGGKRFFFRAIRHTDTPLKVLRDAGFNTIWLDEGSTSAQVAEAVNLGFWVVPSLSVGPTSTAEAGGSPDTFLTSNPVLGKTVSRFLEQDGVLFWDLGGGGLAMRAADRGRVHGPVGPRARPAATPRRGCLGWFPALLPARQPARRPPLAAHDRPGDAAVSRMVEPTPAARQPRHVPLDLGANAPPRLAHGDGVRPAAAGRLQ